MIGEPDAPAKSMDVGESSPSDCLVKRSDIRAHELDGEGLLFDPVSADTHHLNETAYWIWKQCDGRGDRASIAARLAEVYDVPEEAAVRYVREALKDLHDRNLVSASHG